MSVHVNTMVSSAGNGEEGINALYTNITFISQTGMGSASPSRRVLWSEIADKEDEHNDVSSEVDEFDHSQEEDAHNNDDVDPNVTNTINGSGRDQVTSAIPGTVIVSYNEVEKIDSLLVGQLDSFDVVRPTRGRLKKMAAKGGKETLAISK
ncbi:hypothetical protein NE237_011230 [Protea cynaroides]|uniref:Uncharacterized protein n=1 Tax=Protea cynaroides TaxID=273540 RepID=A0A9Q0GYQ7_9MAGN|nr:hypothetical protein NE237_011230 [Protea cynaroides]